MAPSYAFKFGRVTISGKCCGGAEEWSTGFQMGYDNASVGEVAPLTAQAISDFWTTFFTNPTTSISNTYTTEEVKVALINEDGTTNVDQISYFTYPAPINGARAGAIFPPQISLAATMTSEFQRGLASKGRMYLPGVAEPVDNPSGLVPATYRTALTGNLKTFFDAINSDVTVLANVVIASKGHKGTTLDANGQPVYTGGRTALVTGVRVGSVYDTQRRRRNGLAESYTTAVLA